MQSTKSCICSRKFNQVIQNLVIACITIVSISGCAGTGSALLDYKGEDAGSVVLSLGQSDNPLMISPTLSGYRLGASDEFELQYPANLEGVVLLDEWQSGSGTVVAKKLPPGEYEINRANFSVGIDAFRFSTLLVRPVRFSIKPGEASYIGAYLVILKTPKSKLTDEPGKVNVILVSDLALDVRISDEQKRDLQSARNRYPELKLNVIKNMVQPSISSSVE